ncbi:helix-turn-helix domain-containing protein [Rhizobium skierniewicense]|uniref:helix-turn-helix domain-containing protein n=1 Tax=Rhizobium skierniewicense TaxID=984260 RepID=UPI003D6EEF21
MDAEVGSRIRSRRRTLGFSQGKLGEALGITFQQIQKYEKGTNRVGASRLQAIASVLGVPIEYFFGGNAVQGTGSSTHTDLLAVHELTAFLQTAEAKELNAAFSKVKSPTVRMRGKRCAAPIHGTRSQYEMPKSAGATVDQRSRDPRISS